MRTTIIIPTYNEKENITELIERISHEAGGAGWKLLVIDDASPDGTGAIVDRLAAQYPFVTCVHRTGKLGLGSAYREGFLRALADDAEILVTMDADFSHHPRYLHTLIETAGRADCVIGSRYVNEGGQQGWSRYRQFLSAGANLFARTLLRLHTHDATAGFRAYRASVFKKIPVASIHSDGYSFQIEMVTRIERQGMGVREVPILFENRTRGASKISRSEVLQGFLTVLRLFIVRK